MAELSKQALIVDNNQSFPNNNAGAITPAVLRSYNRDVIDSTVNQSVYNADSASFLTLIDNTDTNIGNLVATASVNVNVITFTKDNGSTFNLSVTASIPTLPWDNITDKPTGLVSGSSQVVSILTPLNAFSASQITKDSTLATYTGSVDTKFSTLATYTGSNDTKWSNLGSQSGSFVTESETGSFARTNVSNTFTTTQNITGDLNVTGTINANKLNVIIESSSVIFSSGSNILGDSTSDIQTLNGTVIISGSQQITGSLNLTPASVSTNAQYVIPFISGSTISKDSVDTLFYNPSTNTLQVSASASGVAAMTPNNISFTSGSGNLTSTSIISKAQFQSAVEGGIIGISGNPSKTGIPSLATFTNPGITALSGSGTQYVAIELQASASFTDGRVTIKRPLVVEQGISGSIVQNGGANTINGITTINNNTIIGNNGTLNVAGGITANSGIAVLNGSGIDLKANTEGSGSAYINVTSTVDNTTDPTNVYSSFQLIDQTQTPLIAIAANSYTAEYPNTTIPYLFGGGNNPNGTNAGIAFPTNGNMDVWKKSNFAYGVDVTGSVRGNVLTQTITSNTASFDFSTSNFFELNLTSGASTRIQATNVKPGQTVNVKVKQASPTTGSVTFSNQFDFPQFSGYTASLQAGAVDILTFITFNDTSSIYSAAIKNLL